MKLGYVGVGNMGGAIAAALARQHEVQVYDPSEAAVRPCLEAGAMRAVSLPEMRDSCAIVFLCLPKFSFVQNLLSDEFQLAPSGSAAPVYVDQTTSHPLEFTALAARMSADGYRLIDAPVSGGPRSVRAGTASFAIGGEAETVAEVTRLLDPFAASITHTGGAGSAMAAKMINNYLCALGAVSALQALALAAVGGGDVARCVEYIRSSSGSNYYIENIVEAYILTGVLEIGATIDVMRKDVAMAIEVADASGIGLVGRADLLGLIDECIARYGATASYNSPAVLMCERHRIALGALTGVNPQA